MIPHRYKRTIGAGPVLSRRGRLGALSSVLFAMLGLSPTSQAQAARDYTYNPNHFDAVKTIEAMKHPHPDLVIVSAHRGLHSVPGDRTDVPGVPENSLAAVAAAAKAGLEVLELDVKETPDGVLTFSHDKTWGRQAVPRQGGASFDPFLDPSLQTALNPVVTDTTYATLRADWVLRDSVTFRYPSNPEPPPTLQDVINFYNANQIQTVLAFDIKDKQTFHVVWNQIKGATDFLGRPFRQNAVFKISGNLYPTPQSFHNDFGLDAPYINMWWIYNTSDIDPSKYGSEQAISNSLNAFYQDTSLSIISAEITQKQPGGILDQMRQTNIAQGRSVAQFSATGDYFAPYDPTTPRFFSSQDGSCVVTFNGTPQACQTLNMFYYTHPSGAPADTADVRYDLNFVVDHKFNIITADTAQSWASQLAARGLRNLSHLRESGNCFGDDLNSVYPGCDTRGQSIYTFCAAEGRTCSFTGTRIVAYGANGLWNYFNATNSVNCNNATLGPDPAPNRHKACYISPPLTQDPDSIYCADENGICRYSSSNGSPWSTIAITGHRDRTLRIWSSFGGSSECTVEDIASGSFEDPDPGVVKACHYELAGDTPNIGRGPDGYSICAQEGQACQFAGRGRVAFGIDGQFNFRVFDGGVDCSTAEFGDPAQGVQKACYYQNMVPAANTLGSGSGVNPSDRPLRILPTGDSITWGEGDPSGNGYRHSLIKQLLNSGFGVTMVGSERNGQFANNYNEGHRGWRIDQISSIVGSTLAKWQPNVITLMIGTNDCLQQYDTVGAPGRLNSLVRQIFNNSPNTAVALATLIPAASAQSCVQNLNANIPGIVSQLQSEGRSIVLADMGAVTLSDLPDGIHPNPAGYTKIANAFHTAVDQLFERGMIKAAVGCDQLPVGCSDPAITSGSNNHLGEGGIDTPPGDGGISPATPQPRQAANGWDPHRDWASGTNIDGVVQYADMDGNRRADLVIIDKVTGALQVIWNTGTGWVGPVVFEPTGAGPGARVRLADMDGDGKADYLVIDPNSGAVTGFRNNGGITGNGWTPWGVIASGAAPAAQVQFADMNGDGKADYVVADRLNGALDVYINNGTEMPGGNGWIPMRRAASGAAPGAMVRLADINGDHFADYLVVNPVNGAVVAYLNNGMEVPGGNGWIPLGKIAIGTGAPGSWVQFADITADDVADYLVVNPVGGHTDAYLNNGGDLPSDGNPQYPVRTPQPRQAVNGWDPKRDWASGTTIPGVIRYADMDGDGKADFVVIDEVTGALHVVWNTGHGWVGPVLYAGGAAPAEKVRLADIDGDGKADYLVIDPNTGAVTAYRNDGGNPGNDWGYLGQIASGAAPASQVQFADMNADGKADYVVVRPDILGGGSSGSLEIYLNNGLELPGGHGWIDFAATSPLSPQGTIVRLADINGDYFADYLAVDPTNGAVNAFLNNGMVDFSTGWHYIGVFATGAAPGDIVQFADVEGDNAADYLVVHPNGGRTDAYLNRGGDLPQSQP